MKINHCIVKKEDLKSILNSEIIKEYNPFKDYFENLEEWDGETDYIQQLSTFIEVEPEERERWELNFKKHIVRTVSGALTMHLNKQALILLGVIQDIGKTTFLRWLCPPELVNYYTENLPKEKDALISMAKNFIINLDEMVNLERQEINSLKSFLSSEKTNVRVPYGRTQSLQIRRCSFYGTTNEIEFLTDGTGNVRWLCFDVKGVNHDYKKLDLKKIWSQAFSLCTKKKYNFNCLLTKSEILQNENANIKFLVRTVELDLMQIFFIPANVLNSQAEFKTTTEIADYLYKNSSQKITTKKLGNALKILGYVRQSRRLTNSKFPVYGYYLIPTYFDKSQTATQNEFEVIEDELQEIEIPNFHN